MTTNLLPPSIIAILHGQVDGHGEACTWCQTIGQTVSVQMYVAHDDYEDAMDECCAACVDDVITHNESDGWTVAKMEVSRCA